MTNPQLFQEGAPVNSAANTAPEVQQLDGIPLWDGVSSVGPATLRWRGDRIEQVTADSTAPRSELSIIPGLVDTHVHLGSSASAVKGDWVSWPLITPPEERALHIAANAQQAARGGVTTLRDLAGDELQLSVSRAFDSGILAGPRLLVNGQVGMTAGHGDLFIPPHYPHRPPVADSPDECRKLVRHWARVGAHGVKIYTSGGVLSMGDRVGWRNQTMAEILTTLDEAHALGLKVAAHTHSSEGVDIALEVGVDSIEHGTGVTSAHWETLVARNLPVAPTLLINDAIADGRVPISAEAQAKAQEVVADRNRNFAGAGAAGVRFVLGTDANGFMVRFGDQHEEVRLMAEMFEWSAERALQAATSDAADAVGLGASVGRLQEGYGADFIVLRGRPWETIDDLRPENIVAVVSRGVVVSGSLPL
ncbi:metal-dependent hydrolase family protein [Psychromicrobium xiongbiense]|uniref:metal-dependent hydrolase family protein n=1 Tax=Psychromicrobium xiongbiense TaxID=3051184 RepID=UPI002554DD1F|nr:amidohydrolase family protein [Psychromicrobium sp. YIM S02556]